MWIRADWSGPGGPRGQQPLLVDQECSGPPWTTLRHFPDALEMDDSSTMSHFQEIGRKEMHEQRVQFESIVYKPLDTDAHAIKKYLKNIFSSKKA